MVGQSASRVPDLVRRIAQGGHAIGNHTWDHRSFAAIPRRERLRQIRSCARAIFPYGRRLFRPPWGHQTVVSRLDTFSLRHEVICWSVQVGDWWDTDASHMAEQLTARVRPGSIVLLHDAIISDPSSVGAAVAFDREPMLCAMELFFQRVEGQFRFVTIPEMFKFGRPIRSHWFHTPAAG